MYGKDFVAMINRYLSMGIGAFELADALGVSTDTVIRWRDEQILPAMPLREPIQAVLRAKF